MSSSTLFSSIKYVITVVSSHTVFSSYTLFSSHALFSTLTLLSIIVFFIDSLLICCICFIFFCCCICFIFFCCCNCSIIFCCCKCSILFCCCCINNFCFSCATLIGIRFFAFNEKFNMLLYYIFLFFFKYNC